MIKRLDLQDYGKFRKASLEFGPFTVLTGANEAGKTTVFDALFDALCETTRHEGRPAWKNLADRYGALRKAVLTWKGEPFSFDYAEFLEIFAIRAGDSGVNAAHGRTWETMAEARLLNAGLNPAALAASLIDKADSTRKGTAQARIKELNKRLKAMEPELAELKARRDAIFAGEADTARLEGELAAKNSALEARQAELRALVAQADELGDACRLQSALEGLKALREAEEAGAALAELAPYEKDELPAYRAILAERRERERAADAAEAGLAERRAASAAARASAEALAARAPELERLAEAAAALSAKVAAFAAAPARAVSAVNKPLRYGLWAGALALAAFVAFSGRGAAAYAAALAIAGAGAWVGLKLSVKETLVSRTAEETKVFTDALAAEWALVSADPLPADLEAARAVLAKPAADHAALLENYNARAAEIGELEAGLAAFEGNLGEFRQAAQDAADSAAAWLKARGCDTEEDYQAKVTNREKLAARSADLAERLKVYLQRQNCATREKLRDKLLDEREALNRKGVNPDKADEPELERVKQRAAAAAREAHAAEAAAAEVRAALKTAQAVAGARLEGLPDQINRLETERAAGLDEIAALELQVQAYMLAAEVFNKLAEESTVAFEALAKEVGAMLQLALPGAEAEFGSFDPAAASLKDAGGKLRPVGHLSSGARDLFMFAARLVMAKKARLGDDGVLAPALLVLDDPFYTLDPDRERAALRLLTAFHRDTGWQVIILTKDIGLAKACLATGLTVKITEL